MDTGDEQRQRQGRVALLVALAQQVGRLREQLRSQHLREQSRAIISNQGGRLREQLQRERDKGQRYKDQCQLRQKELNDKGLKAPPQQEQTQPDATPPEAPSEAPATPLIA